MGQAGDPRILTFAVVALAALAFFGYRHVHRYDHLPLAFRTSTGAKVYDNYMDGCRKNGRESACKCLFDRITSVPPYTTPQGFGRLDVETMQSMMTGKGIPPILLDAAMVCIAAGA